MKKLIKIAIPLFTLLFLLALAGCGKANINGYWKTDSGSFIKIEKDTIYAPDITINNKFELVYNGLQEEKLEYDKDLKAYHIVDDGDPAYLELKDDGKLYGYYYYKAFDEREDKATYSKASENEWNDYISTLEDGNFLDLIK